MSSSSPPTFTFPAGPPPPDRTEPAETLWEVVLGVEMSGPIADRLDELAAGSHELRAAALLQTLGRIRLELERMPADANPTDPVVLRASDVALVAGHLLRGVR